MNSWQQKTPRSGRATSEKNVACQIRHSTCRPEVDPLWRNPQEGFVERASTVVRPEPPRIFSELRNQQFQTLVRASVCRTGQAASIRVTHNRFGALLHLFLSGTDHSNDAQATAVSVQSNKTPIQVRGNGTEWSQRRADDEGVDQL